MLLGLTAMTKDELQTHLTETLKTTQQSSDVSALGIPVEERIRRQALFGGTPPSRNKVSDFKMLFFYAAVQEKQLPEVRAKELAEQILEAVKAYKRNGRWVVWPDVYPSEMDSTKDPAAAASESTAADSAEARAGGGKGSGKGKGGGGKSSAVAALGTKDVQPLSTKSKGSSTSLLDVKEWLKKLDEDLEKVGGSITPIQRARWRYVGGGIQGPDAAF